MRTPVLCDGYWHPPSHNVEVWLHPVYQALIASVLRWCQRADLQE